MVKATSSKIFNGMAPLDGNGNPSTPRSIYVTLDFNGSDPLIPTDGAGFRAGPNSTTQVQRVYYKYIDHAVEVDLSQCMSTAGIKFLQSVYIDNKNNPFPLELIFKGTSQSIVAEGYTQGYYPIISGDTYQFTAFNYNSAATGDMPAPFNTPQSPGGYLMHELIFLTSAMPACQWSTRGMKSGVWSTNYGFSHSTAFTSTTILNPNAYRKGLIVQNLTNFGTGSATLGTANQWIGFGVNPSIASGFLLRPGESFVMIGEPCYVGDVRLISAITHDSYSCFELGG